MTAYAVVRATPEHGASVAANMREADIAECWAGWRHTPAEAVERSLAGSRDPLAGLADGHAFCVFGVAAATALSSAASPWMLGTNELPRHSRPFLRANRLYVGHIKSEYDILENYVDARNTLAVKWLKWLGFTMEEATPFGPDRLPFHRFWSMTTVVRKCSVAEVERNASFAALMEEYADELKVDGLPRPSMRIEMHRQLEAMGKLQVIGAFLDGALIGLINVLITENPHHASCIAVTESFFVAKAYRKGGAGLKLLRAAEQHAKEQKSPSLLVSAPVGGPLAEVLPRCGYRETNRTFLKGLTHG